MPPLDRKLLRDLVHLKSQMAAVALVVACGIALFVALRSMHGYLATTQQRYYQEYRFADLFASFRQAPLGIAQRASALPGVAAVEARIVQEVLLDLPGLAEPATGRLVSIPERGQPAVNALHLRRGRWIAPGGRDEVLISEAFSRANRLEPGSTFGAVIHGRWQTLRVVGVALSPEYVYEIRGAGDLFPDNRRFGVLWMGREALAAAFDLEGSCNDLALALAPGARPLSVIEGLDRLLAPWGGLGAYGREDHVSHRFVSDEIAETRVTSVLIPGIFLGVTAFLLHIVLLRLVATQRDQIAVLKAFGYTDGAVGGHYLKMALVPVVAGSAVGCGLGLWFAVGLAGIYARFYQFPILRYEPDPWVLFWALAIGGGSALVGALAAVRRALRLPPAEAMRPEAPARFRAGLAERLGLMRRLPPAGRMVLRNLERHPVKAFLSAFGLALAVAILVSGRFTFDAVEFMEELQFEVIEREDVNVVFATLRPRAVVHHLARLPGVLRVEPYRVVPARLVVGPREERAALLGLELESQLHRIVDRRFAVHRPPPGGLLLSKKMAEMLDVRPGETLTVEVLEGARPHRELRVSGLVDELIGVAAYLELADLNRVMREGRAVSGAYLAVDSRHAHDLYQSLKGLPAVTSVAVRQAAREGFRKTVAESFRLSIVMLIVFGSVIAFGMVYNSARISLSERGRELASLRILGFSRGEVAVILLGEQAVLTALALPLGLLLGWGLAALIVLRFESEMFRIPLVISTFTYAFALVVVGLAALLSAAAVRHRLDHLDLVAVLKTRE
ncbi:MAG TPA: ABC transporter permease [Thermoanaerobaculia bacterium]|nr:ABC transporter permease [Thermoanaerobaculia bacterium]